MKRILGLDLGSTSIGWALVNEADLENESSSIIKTGVRVIPLTTDEQGNFEKGKAITTNQDRTAKRSARRNLQRYKLRRNELIKILKSINFIEDSSILSEDGKRTTFQTLEIRAKAAIAKIEKEELARVFIAINKKRGYKSSRKAKNEEDGGNLIDGMSVARELQKRGLTPGQYSLDLLLKKKKNLPDYYRSDLQDEFDKIWNFQKQYHLTILTDVFYENIKDKGQRATSASFWNKYGFNTAENKGDRNEKKLQAYQWRVKALSEKLDKEEVAYVITEINNDLNKSSGYLGAISDRSKELYFNKQTVGQYLLEQIKNNPHTRLKNQVFYRKDYEDEFDVIWNEQSKHHKELTDDLKNEIKNIIIFYQRPLKSQKGLISICELEGAEREILVDGKVKKKIIGPRVCPKSSPLFQEFRIWQRLNDLVVEDKKEGLKLKLDEESKALLFEELNIKAELSSKEFFSLLSKNSKNFELNFKKLDGNRTISKLYEAYNKIIVASGHGEHDFSKMNAQEINQLVSEVFGSLGINTSILTFDSTLEGKEIEQQAFYQLWHLLYSYEGDKSKTGNESLIQKLGDKFGFENEYAKIMASVTFEDDYGSLSSKAIAKILPHLKDGLQYDEAAKLAGYNHSKSLNKEERANKILKERLELLEKNSLRNPVVEKILNQTINVVNAIIDEYGKPDEIRLELARELKKSAKEREEMTLSISRATAEYEKVRKVLQTEFGLPFVSRNDIIRYRLWKETEGVSIYSGKLIKPSQLFSKEIDIEHIIPKARLFDDSFANKTLCERELNREKSNDTSYDYLKGKLTADEFDQFLSRVEDLYKNKKIGKGKYKKLMMESSNIPDDFIERDLRNSQYIAKKTKELLEEVCRTVNTTTGSVTNKLREDWQLIHVMQELNWDKYDKQGLTYYETNKKGVKLPRIKAWTKRNDHRHHAMDALTVAFTKYNHVQYLNNLNTRRGDEKSSKTSAIYAIEKKELYKDENGKLKFKPPMPLENFRSEAKKQLENTLISFKAKNKVVTPNKNKIKKKVGYKIQDVDTPRGQLHLETIYGSIKQYEAKNVKVGSNFDETLIKKVAKKKYRDALLDRFISNDKDAKKAFSGKNSLTKNPIYLDEKQQFQMPDKVKIVEEVTVYTIRKPISPELKVEKVIDVKIKQILQQRLEENGGDPKKAFVNLDENPIWLNKEKGIEIKSVTIKGVSNAISLHDKKDKNGKLILDKKGKTQPVDFVNTGNNHHVAIYKDAKGNLQEDVVTFFDALARVNEGLPIINKTFNIQDGWEFKFTLKQNEYFVFPNESTGFFPNEIDLMDENNYYLISPNLFRVQKFGSLLSGFWFRHHLETNIEVKKELKHITFKVIQSANNLKGIIKVRINHLGKIVAEGEY